MRPGPYLQIQSARTLNIPDILTSLSLLTLTVAVGVGVADDGRVLPGLAQHGQTVGSVRPRSGSTVRSTAPGTVARSTIPSQHQIVEVQTNLK